MFISLRLAFSVKEVTIPHINKKVFDLEWRDYLCKCAYHCLPRVVPSPCYNNRPISPNGLVSRDIIHILEGSLLPAGRRNRGLPIQRTRCYALPRDRKSV